MVSRLANNPGVGDVPTRVTKGKGGRGKKQRSLSRAVCHLPDEEDAVTAPAPGIHVDFDHLWDLVERGIEKSRTFMDEKTQAKEYATPAFPVAKICRPYLWKCGCRTANDALQVVDSVLGRLYFDLPSEERWVAALGETDSFGDHSDPQADFMHSWDSLVSSGQPYPFETALMLSGEEEIVFPEWVALRTKGYRKWLTLGHHLFHVRYGMPFQLASRIAGEALGISRNTAAAYARRAVADGIVEITTPATKGANGKAARMRFLVRLKTRPRT